MALGTARSEQPFRWLLNVYCTFSLRKTHNKCGKYPGRVLRAAGVSQDKRSEIVSLEAAGREGRQKGSSPIQSGG